jgi:hypothetical protein
MSGGVVVKDEGILTADDMAPSMGVKTHREWIKKMTIDSRAARVMLDNIAVSYEPAGVPIVAQVNHGRWIGMCECGGAENVTPTDPIFFCFSCYNMGSKYHVRPVVFPEPKEQDAIAATLMERHHKDMHWLPGETHQDLKGQNKVLRETGKLKGQKE